MSSQQQRVGILGLQGCIEPHANHIRMLGHVPCTVRTVAELHQVERLIIPGGESTTMLKLLRRADLFEPLRHFALSNPVWGVCAGAILLAEKVLNPEQESLSVLPICAKRNAYGSQLDSFQASIAIDGLAGDSPIDVDFIRAPKLEALDSAVDVLAVYDHSETGIKEPVLFQHNVTLCSAFHTELGTDSRMHQYFLNI